MTGENEDPEAGSEVLSVRPPGSIGARAALAITMAALSLAPPETVHLDQTPEGLSSNPDNLDTKSEET